MGDIVNYSWESARAGCEASCEGTVAVAQPRSHGPEEGSIPPLPSLERAPYRITRSGKRGRQRYKTKGTVYLPATTVPPTVVALCPKRAETVAWAQAP